MIAIETTVRDNYARGSKNDCGGITKGLADMKFNHKHKSYPY